MLFRESFEIAAGVCVSGKSHSLLALFLDLEWAWFVSFPQGTPYLAVSHPKQRKQLAGSWTTPYQGSAATVFKKDLCFSLKSPSVSNMDGIPWYLPASPDDLLFRGSFALPCFTCSLFPPPSKCTPSSCFHRRLWPWISKGKCATHPFETVAKHCIQERASPSTWKSSKGSAVHLRAASRVWPGLFPVNSQLLPCRSLKYPDESGH